MVPHLKCRNIYAYGPYLTELIEISYLGKWQPRHSCFILDVLVSRLNAMVSFCNHTPSLRQEAHVRQEQYNYDSCCR